MSDSDSQSNADESSDEYKRTTLYLRSDVKRQYERWQLRLELEQALVEDAYKRELHEALVAVAMMHTDDFLSLLQDCVDDPEKFVATVENFEDI